MATDDDTISQLRLAMEHRTTIGIALGILMERFDLTQDAAWTHLVRESSVRQRKLYALADELRLTRQLADG